MSDPAAPPPDGASPERRDALTVRLSEINDELAEIAKERLIRQGRLDGTLRGRLEELEHERDQIRTELGYARPDKQPSGLQGWLLLIGGIVVVMIVLWMSTRL